MMAGKTPATSTSNAALLAFVATLDIRDGGAVIEPDAFLARWHTLVTEARKLRPHQVEELRSLVADRIGTEGFPPGAADPAHSSEG